MLGMDIYEKKSEDKFVKVIKDGYRVYFFIKMKRIELKLILFVFYKYFKVIW